MDINLIKLNGKTYGVFAINHEKIGVVPTGFGKVFYMRVQADCEHTYKLMKTKILARGGADGLVEYLKYCDRESFMECLAAKVCEHVIANGRGAK